MGNFVFARHVSNIGFAMFHRTRICCCCNVRYSKRIILSTVSCKLLPVLYFCEFGGGAIKEEVCFFWKGLSLFGCRIQTSNISVSH